VKEQGLRGLGRLSGKDKGRKCQLREQQSEQPAEAGGGEKETEGQEMEADHSGGLGEE